MIMDAQLTLIGLVCLASCALATAGGTCGFPDDAKCDSTGTKYAWTWASSTPSASGANTHCLALTGKFPSNVEMCTRCNEFDIEMIDLKLSASAPKVSSVTYDGSLLNVTYLQPAAPNCSTAYSILRVSKGPNTTLDKYSRLSATSVQICFTSSGDLKSLCGGDVCTASIINNTPRPGPFPEADGKIADLRCCPLVEAELNAPQPQADALATTGGTLRAPNSPKPKSTDTRKSGAGVFPYHTCNKATRSPYALKHLPSSNKHQVCYSLSLAPSNSTGSSHCAQFDLSKVELSLGSSCSKCVKAATYNSQPVSTSITSIRGNAVLRIAHKDSRHNILAAHKAIKAAAGKLCLVLPNKAASTGFKPDQIQAAFYDAGFKCCPVA